MIALASTIAILAIVFAGSYLTLFLMWVLVTNFERARNDGQLKHSVVVFGYLVAGIGYLVDVWCNLLSTFVFLEPPREFTVSERLRRLVQTSGWRRTLATWFAITLINPFAVGGPHIIIPSV